MSEISPTERIQTIGAQIKNLRTQSSTMGYAKWAIKHGFDPRQYYRLEKGEANFTINTLLRILDIHGITLDEFFKDLE